MIRLLLCTLLTAGAIASTMLADRQATRETLISLEEMRGQSSRVVGLGTLERRMAAACPVDMGDDAELRASCSRFVTSELLGSELLAGMPGLEGEEIHDPTGDPQSLRSSLAAARIAAEKSLDSRLLALAEAQQAHNATRSLRSLAAGLLVGVMYLIAQFLIKNRGPQALT
ncbi:MAG: hypothetical protein AAF725_17830 [Acidobacteriota bacterium]